MRIIGFGLMVMLGAFAPAGASFELRLTTRLPEQLPYLFPDMRLEVVNSSASAMQFPMNAYHVLLYLETDEGWRECRPLVQSRPRPLASIEWKEVAAGESFQTGIPGSRCAEGKGTWFEWANEPGTHRVMAKLTTYAHRIGVPPGAFDGVLESNVLEFRVKEPAGVEAEAIAWAKGSPMKVELLDVFPTSEYAAFFIYGVSARLDQADPVKIRSLLERGRYPGSNSVPDRNGWRSMNSEGIARWQMEWGQLILQHHPDFAFRDEIEVSIALAQMSLGEREKAVQALTTVADTGNPAAAEWSRVFLDTEPR